VWSAIKGYVCRKEVGINGNYKCERKREGSDGRRKREKNEMTEGEEGLGLLTVRDIAEYANTPLYLILKIYIYI
jgi:hypothetical protein